MEPTSKSKPDHCDFLFVQYAACLHQNNWFVSSVNNISVPIADAEVNLMHPKGPSHFFNKWPQRQDICWIPS